MTLLLKAFIGFIAFKFFSKLVFGLVIIILVISWQIRIPWKSLRDLYILNYKDFLKDTQNLKVWISLLRELTYLY